MIMGRVAHDVNSSQVKTIHTMPCASKMLPMENVNLSKYASIAFHIKSHKWSFEYTCKMKNQKYGKRVKKTGGRSLACQLGLLMTVSRFSHLYQAGTGTDS
jgi:hypothetical protein